MLLPVLISLVLTQGYAPGREGTTPLDEAHEARVTRVAKQIRCMVCQGTSIADSPASMARAQLDKVREMVAAGNTDDEIFDYFVARYGEFSLMNPRKDGSNSLLWALPVVLLLGGLIVIFAMRSKPKEPPAPTVAAAETVEDPYLAAVRADLKK